MNLEQFWGPEYPAVSANPPAPSAGRVRAWESRHGVRLPATLAAALAVQDGGCVRGCALVLYPLDEVEPLGAGRFRFGADDEAQAQLVLDYSAGGEPRILRVPHDSGREIEQVPGVTTFDELVRGMRERTGVRAEPGASAGRPRD